MKYIHIHIPIPHTEKFVMFPVKYLVPNFLTRAVLCAGKEAWKRRPFLLSSQICSNYRITSICGSLAAFSLPPPPLSSPVFSLFPSLLSFAFSPIPHFFFPAFIFLACPHGLLVKKKKKSSQLKQSLWSSEHPCMFFSKWVQFLAIQLGHACKKQTNKQKEKSQCTSV